MRQKPAAHTPALPTSSEVTEPKPKGRRPRGGVRNKKPRRHRDEPTWFAVAGPGLGPALADEVENLKGATIVEADDAGVLFAASMEVGLGANFFLRTATRIWRRLGGMTARDFVAFRTAATEMPWETFLRPGQAVRIQAETHHCKLFHTGALAERLLGAIEDKLQGKVVSASGAAPTGADPGDPEASEALEGEDVDPGVDGLAPLRILVRGQDNEFQISVDSSGDLLHRRGYRTHIGAAPLRETLAAGILRLAAWRPEEVLMDPMCGSGTFATEAALWALDRPPGVGRSFAFENWNDADGLAKKAWRAIKRGHEARQRAKAAPLPRGKDAPPALRIWSWDRDPKAIEAAMKNAEQAGVDNFVQFKCMNLKDISGTAGRTLVVCNPPYGHRLGDKGQARATYAALGEMLRGPWRFARSAILVSNPNFLSLLPPASETIAMRNGGLPITLALIPPQAKSGGAVVTVSETSPDEE